MMSPTALRAGLVAAIGIAALVVIAVVLLSGRGAEPAPASGEPAGVAAGQPDAEPAPESAAPEPAAGGGRSRCARVSADALEAIGEGVTPGAEIGGPAFYARTRAVARTWVIAVRVTRGDRVGPGIWATRINPGKTSGLIGPFVALNAAARQAAAWPAERPPRRLGPRPDGSRDAVACLRAGRRV